MSTRVDIASLRSKIESGNGREYWKSLEELSETEEFHEFVRHEFPRDVELWMEPISRRTFLKLMSASLALAFFSGCRKPLENILPYNKPPEDMVPGKPLYFSSVLPFQGYARGVLVESQMGRPTKIEGNPQHPDSFGATDIFSQAELLSFYDPDRSQVVTRDGIIATWNDFNNALRAVIEQQKMKQGSTLRILTESTTSPTFIDQLSRLKTAFPKSKWITHDAFARENITAGAQRAFGKPFETRYQFSNAERILALDSDFLTQIPGSISYTRAYSVRRQPTKNQEMNRLYVVESNYSVTGGMADHRLPLSHAAIEHLARSLAANFGHAVAQESHALSSSATQWIGAVARDLDAHRGRSLVIAGPTQPPIVHAIAHALNETLRNVGHTVFYSDPVSSPGPTDIAEFRNLVDDMREGKVEALLILGGNPVYTAPHDLNFAQALDKVPFTARAGLYSDETSQHCHWHLPEAHPLESWGDLRAFDGTASIVQPLIAPLYESKSAIEIMSTLVDASPKDGLDIVQRFWKSQWPASEFDARWNAALATGIIRDSAFPPRTPKINSRFDSPPTPAWGPQELEIVFQSDPTILDGRYANNGWLQELPKPVTKLTWDNAALLAPAMAERMNLSNGDLVELKIGDQTIEAPIWIVPGNADRSVTVTMGYGRTRAGRVGNNAGFNANLLRTSKNLWTARGLTIGKTNRSAPLVSTQHHYSMEGRDLVRATDIATFRANPDFAKSGEKSPKKKETLYDYSMPGASDQYAWGMAIDLNMCIGCSACTIACQAENNIPIVGKNEVARGRAMHWIRVDRYHTGTLDNPQTVLQPVPCMHCEDAPCELVCPVGATTHSDEGLNQMVYNRCVGTRYCSNNCPYKVRRFNFLNYTDAVKGPLKMMQNPDVTVRARGVMEKCTYCVQRIQQAKIGAEKENRNVRDGEITPACAQACPAQAIVFGNLKDAMSAVVQRKSDPRDYGLLTELGTRPRTTYQARLRNPNPEIKEATS